MIITQFKLFIRYLNKNRTLSAINILGLVFGMLCTLFILEYVTYEKSYDSHHEHADNIYRIVYDRYKGDELMWQTTYSFAPMPSYLKENYDEVVNGFQMRSNNNANFTFTNEKNELISFNEAKAYMVSSSIFDMLNIALLKGDKKCLDEPNTVAISDRLAQKYFPNENPIGKQLMLNQGMQFSITAVYKAFPHNTHFRTDVLLTYQNFLKNNPNVLTNWGREGIFNYIQLKPGTDPDAFANKVFPVMKEVQTTKIMKAQNIEDHFYLQRMSDIHLTSNIENEMEVPGSKRAVQILFVFSLFFIIIAWINYINLISARAIERAKEVGIKKISGASKRSLMLQFLGETFLFNIFTLAITFALFLALNPAFKEFTNIEDFNLFTYQHFSLYFAFFLLLGILLSGLYSSFILTAVKPIHTIKGKYIKSYSGMLFRKGLVTFQFVVSLVLFIGTIVSYVQFTHLSQKEIGINLQSKLAIKMPHVGAKAEEMYKQMDVLKQNILQIASVKDVCVVSDMPGNEIVANFGGRREGTSGDQRVAFFNLNGDNNMLDFFKIRLVAGEDYKSDDLPEANKILVNESATQRFGFTTPKDAVGASIIGGKGDTIKYTIIGVTEDFQYKSMKVEPVPLVMTNFDVQKNFLVLKMTSLQNADQVLESCKSAYSKVFQHSPFEYYFVEDIMNHNLKPDKTFVQVFSLFSLQAIIIALLGVLGLLIITINQNMKQIGVRKVMGAKKSNIFKILISSLLPEFIISILIALPVSYLVLEHYVLNQYIYRIDLEFQYFALPVVLLSILVLTIVYFQARRAYNANVVEVMRFED